MMNTPSNTSSNIPVQKIRLIGDDEEDPHIEEDDGDNSIGALDEEDEEDEEDNENDIVDDDEDDLNSVDADETEPDLDVGNAAIARTVSKSGNGRVLGIQPMGVAVPPQFLDANNAGGDETDDDFDTENMSGNVTGDDEYDDDDEDPETYLQKFDLDVNNDLLMSHHPTQFNKNDSEISVLCQLTRNASNNVIDPLHKTTPFLTKYEKTRVLGQRAKQINSGSKPYVVVPDNILDGYIIAQMELAQKRIPFIVERPIHGGGCEYWRVRDLEIL